MIPCRYANDHGVEIHYQRPRVFHISREETKIRAEREFNYLFTLDSY